MEYMIVKRTTFNIFCFNKNASFSDAVFNEFRKDNWTRCCNNNSKTQSIGTEEGLKKHKKIFQF